MSNVRKMHQKWYTDEVSFINGTLKWSIRRWNGTTDFREQWIGYLTLNTSAFFLLAQVACQGESIARYFLHFNRWWNRLGRQAREIRHWPSQRQEKQWKKENWHSRGTGLIIGTCARNISCNYFLINVDLPKKKYKSLDAESYERHPNKRQIVVRLWSWI